MIISFKNCSVSLNLKGQDSKILFNPSWGVFDMLIGESIVSSFPHAADNTSFPLQKVTLKSHTIHPVLSEEKKELNQLYNDVREMRNGDINTDRIDSILNKLIYEFEDDWLLSLEICELIKGKNEKIFSNAYKHLIALSNTYPDYKKLILDGLNII